jgi:hypothetical protein
VKRIILLTLVVAIIATIMAANALSVGAQDTGEVSDPKQTTVCAPWSKEWDISGGWWYFQWYRWCYDPSVSDPTIEESWYKEWGEWEWWEQANLCPESGICRVNVG